MLTDSTAVAPQTTSPPAPSPHRRPELVWLGHGGWVACDPLAAENDPRRILAYLECCDGRVYVVWVRHGARTGEFPTLREAVDAIDAASGHAIAGPLSGGLPSAPPPPERDCQPSQ